VTRPARLARRLCLGALPLLALPARPQTPGVAELSGQIRITPPEGHKASLAGTAVWLAGVSGDQAPAPPPMVTSRNKRSGPHVLALAAGLA
jgi:hypothetical protein